MPTRTSVSSVAFPLMIRSSSHSTFSKSKTIVEPPETRRTVRDECAKGDERTEGKVAKLLPALDLLALGLGRVDAADHHRADADGHDAPELRTVDGHDLPCVLAVDVERRSYGLRLYDG
jgi:hypothetical protein